MRQAERVQEAGNVVQLHDSQHSSSDSLMVAECWQGTEDLPGVTALPDIEDSLGAEAPPDTQNLLGAECVGCAPRWTRSSCAAALVDSRRCTLQRPPRAGRGRSPAASLAEARAQGTPQSPREGRQRQEPARGRSRQPEHGLRCSRRAAQQRRQGTRSLPWCCWDRCRRWTPRSAVVSHGSPRKRARQADPLPRLLNARPALGETARMLRATWL